MDQPWQIELLGWLRVVQPYRVITRFRSRKAEALLVYLAYFRHRSHPRQQLVELLWPERDPSVGLRRLSVELTSLRHQLEPPGLPAGTVLIATRTTVQLNPAACITDVALFEAALQAARQAGSLDERVRQLTVAAELYRGELLPGYFEDWIVPERQRLAEAFLGALHTLVGLLEELGDVPGALQWARRAVAADPLDAESHHRLIRLLLATGQVEAARLQYEQGQELLLRDLGSGLSPEVRSLIRELAPIKDRPPVPPAGKQRQRRRRNAGSLEGELPDSPTAIAAMDEAVRTTSPRQPSAAAVRPSDNLPLRFTRFFGREEEIERLCALLLFEAAGDGKFAGDASPIRNPKSEIRNRLLTLTGPGGTGKTRLALQVTERLRNAFPGGVWFVSLRDLTNPLLIPDQILLALRLPRALQSEALEQVTAFLSAAPSLLVLDNYEHLVEEGAAVVKALLGQVPHLTVLVTSRHRLDLEGEREFPVAPLPVPVEGSSLMVHGPAKAGLPDPSTLNPQLSTLIACPSVALFVDRAQAVRPDFQVTAHNAAAVEGLCRRLEGLPLAIELAAARSSVLTPQQMLARLRVSDPSSEGGRFGLLVGRQRAADSRHRSLRAALDWSYQLLTPELQRFFARLSVFRGGWTLEAAAAMLDFAFPLSELISPPSQEPGREAKSKFQQALDYLEELRRCSLVDAEPAPCETGGEEMRYRLLVTMQEYGQEQLSADERAMLSQRHLEYYRERYESEKNLPGVGGVTILQRLDEWDREQDNVRAALDWWVESGSALEWMQQPRQQQWHILQGVSYFWLVRGYTAEGRQRLAEILSLPGADVPTHNRAWLLLRAGQLAHQQADFAAAEALLQASAAIYQKPGYKVGGHDCFQTLALVARDQGDYARARSLYERVLAEARERGDERDIASALYGIGHTAYLEGDLETGQSLLEESVQILRKGQAIAWARSHPTPEADNPHDYGVGGVYLDELAWACAHRGEVADACGDYTAARAYLAESLAHFREFGRHSHTAYALHKLGRVAQHQDQWGEAVAHFSESLAFWQQDGIKQGIAACLGGLAAVASSQGEPNRAARLLGAAAALRESRNIPVPPVECAELDRALAAVRSDLGEEAFAAAWAQGQAMPPELATTEALRNDPHFTP